MTGTIRLYSKSGRKIRTVEFYSKDEVKKIIERWREFYGLKMEDGYVQIAIYTHETRVINMDKKRFINIQKAVINKSAIEVEMTDYVELGPFRHETWFHKMYYAEK